LRPLSGSKVRSNAEPAGDGKPLYPFVYNALGPKKMIKIIWRFFEGI
jgi:hypothetical protein